MLTRDYLNKFRAFCLFVWLVGGFFSLALGISLNPGFHRVLLNCPLWIRICNLLPCPSFPKYWDCRHMSLHADSHESFKRKFVWLASEERLREMRSHWKDPVPHCCRKDRGGHLTNLVTFLSLISNTHNLKRGTIGWL